MELFNGKNMLPAYEMKCYTNGSDLSPHTSCLHGLVQGFSTFSRLGAAFTLSYRLAGRKVINEENLCHDSFFTNYTKLGPVLQTDLHIGLLSNFILHICH
jgi:hypothetical protein